MTQSIPSKSVRDDVKVSVCIPVYNVEKYVAQCVRSLMTQTICGLELIFVDDGSPDRSIQIVTDTVQQYRRDDIIVKILRHDCNKGVFFARKTAMQAITGEYFIHCDPDDFVAVDMYQKMYLTAKRNHADMVYCGIANVSQDGRVEGKDPYPEILDPDETIKAFFGQNFLGSLCNRLYRTALNDALFCAEDIPYCEDLFLNAQLLLKCHKIVHVQEALYYYRRNPDGCVHGRSDVHVSSYVKMFLLLEKILPADRFAVFILRNRQQLMLNLIRRKNTAGAQPLFMNLTMEKRRLLSQKLSPDISASNLILLRIGMKSWYMARIAVRLYAPIALLYHFVLGKAEKYHA